MEFAVILTGQYGIPYREIAKVVERNFSVGFSKELNYTSSPIEGALRNDVAKGFFCFSRKYCDIQTLLFGNLLPDVIVCLDEKKIPVKVLYFIANSYWRYRLALLKGVSIEQFVNFEDTPVLHDILKARADAIVDLDKVIKNITLSEMSNLTELLERILHKLNINSSKRNK